METSAFKYNNMDFFFNLLVSFHVALVKQALR